MSHKQAKRERKALRAQGIDTNPSPKTPTRKYLSKSDQRKKIAAFETMMAAAAVRLQNEGFLDENGQATEKGAN